MLPINTYFSSPYNVKEQEQIQDKLACHGLWIYTLTISGEERGNQWEELFSSHSLSSCEVVDFDTIISWFHVSSLFCLSILFKFKQSSLWNSLGMLMRTPWQLVRSWGEIWRQYSTFFQEICINFCLWTLKGQLYCKIDWKKDFGNILLHNKMSATLLLHRDDIEIVATSQVVFVWSKFLSLLEKDLLSPCLYHFTAIFYLLLKGLFSFHPYLSLVSNSLIYDLSQSIVLNNSCIYDLLSFRRECKAKTGYAASIELHLKHISRKVHLQLYQITLRIVVVIMAIFGHGCCILIFLSIFIACRRNL